MNGDILICLVVGYLCGSIPFGLILTKMAGGGDIRTIGSGNIGATNVLRTGRKSLAAATLILDLSLIHISEPTGHESIAYAVFCLKKIFF